MSKKSFLIITLALAGFVGLNSISAMAAHQQLNLENPVKLVNAASVAQKNYLNANPLDMVKNPPFYLNKYVRIKGKFDKFSTLGLDYKPAMKSSEDYISFLIQRPDVADHNVPLSEMKIFLKRSEAEKHIDLNAGDIVEFTGKVFSNALGDVWIDVDNFKVLTTKPKDECKTTTK